MITSASIFLDKFCDKQSRSGVHLLFSIITGGLAGFAGNSIAGLILDCSKDNYRLFWGVPLFIALLVMVGVIFLMPSEPEKADS